MNATTYKLVTEYDFDTDSYCWVITQSGTNMAYSHQDGYDTEEQAAFYGQRELDYLLAKQA